VGVSCCWCLLLLVSPAVGVSCCWCLLLLGSPAVGVSCCWCLLLLVSPAVGVFVSGELEQAQLLRTASFPTCGVTALSCPVFPLATGKSPEPAHKNVRATVKMETRTCVSP